MMCHQRCCICAGSIDALGNPTAMFRHFSTGITDAANDLLAADPLSAGGACECAPSV